MTTSRSQSPFCCEEKPSVVGVVLNCVGVPALSPAYTGTKLNGRCTLREHMGLWDCTLAQKRIFLGITFLDLHSFNAENFVHGTVPAAYESRRGPVLTKK